MLHRILTLFRKDVLLEIRQQYAFYGVLLYAGSTIFVLYMTIEQPDNSTWNGLFWIIQLFISINAVAKSFLQENRSRFLYYQTIAGAKEFILSKLLFNSVLMLVMSAVSFVLFALFMSLPIERLVSFILVMFLGSWGLSLVFTFLAALAARAQQNAAIMAILGFPIIIPQLLVLIRITTSLASTSTPVPIGNVGLLAGSDLLVVLLAVILFPFIWKE